MIAWEQRPVEVANLLNPAFCAILLSDAVGGYRAEDKSGMPYPLAYLVLPIVLHRPTREAFPKTARTRMHVWLQEQPHLRVGFAQRVRALVPHTNEALHFAIGAGVLSVVDTGHLADGSTKVTNGDWGLDAEPTVCRQRSQFLGRWLARAGDASTIYVMWGIRP